MLDGHRGQEAVRSPLSGATEPGLELPRILTHIAAMAASRLRPFVRPAQGACRSRRSGVPAMSSFPAVTISSLLTIAALAALSARAATGDGAARSGARPGDAAGEKVFRCATEEPRERRARALGLLVAGGCPGKGPCDSPGTRDSTPIDPLNIRVIVHVIRNGDSSGGVPQDTVDAMIARVNADMSKNATGMQVTLVATRYHDDDEFVCLTAHGTRREVDSLRTRYAETPESACNIYISCQDSTGFTRLAGYAAHPWDPNALDTLGGIWVNRNVAGFANNTATHEIGHALGLYHTAAPEDSGWTCDHPCYEYACGLLACSSENNARGDFAADTPATPGNLTCAPPGGMDCLDVPWGPTQPENFMSYAPDSCRALFTPQQIRRMQCWTKAVLSSWLIQPVGVVQGGPPAAVDVLLRPNPAVREVVVAFSLATAGGATLELLDVSGRRVALRTFAALPAGTHVVNLNEGRGLAPGVYMVRLTQESVVAWRKAVIVH